MQEKKPLVKRVTLKLHGHYAGKTIELGGVKFTDGIVKLFGPTPDIEGLETYLGRSYQAFPVEEEKKDNGTSKDETTSRQGNSESVSGELQPTGAGLEEEGSDEGAGTDDSDSNGSGSLPSGNGHEDSRVSEAKERFEQTNSNKTEPVKLIETLKQLDPKNNDQWTSLGLPRMDAVCKLYGSEGLTRRDIEAVWPEFNRELAEKENAERK